MKGAGSATLDPAAREFYIRTLGVLSEAGVPYLLGGAYAFARYTGIERHTKDLDVFVRPQHVQSALDALAGAGYQTDLTFPHWLGKAHCGEDFIDLIFSSGNGVGRVDDAWFERAAKDEVFGVPVSLIPAEDMIWHKAYVLERERYDGADVAHLLRARAPELDWQHLLARFGGHWRVLLSHLVLFGFIYPGERSKVPAELFADLLQRAAQESDAEGGAVCQGPLVSREQYLIDIGPWGYKDARVTGGHLSPEDVAYWTAAINQGH